LLNRASFSDVGLQLFVLVEPAFDLAVILLEQRDGQRIAAAGAARAAGLGGLGLGGLGLGR
jgi:hypothetical protein